MTGDTGWMRQAVCATRLDLPWTSDPDARTPAERAEMRSVCAACPVLAQCFAYMADAELTGGWWAGSDLDPDAYGQLTLDLDTRDGDAA